MFPDVRGLSESDVAARRAQGLGNSAPPATSRTYGEIIRENVFTYINIALFLLGVALALVGRVTDAVVSSGVIALNILVSVVQEIRAKHTLDRIALLTRPRATVIRDEQPRQVAPEELVVGDVLQVGAGDQIVLDGSVLAGKMAVDESQLTGESNVILKQKGEPVYSGSFCASGSAVYVAEKVGKASLANQITAGARAFRRVLTPLQNQVYLAIRVIFLIVAYIAFLLILNTLMYEIKLAQTLQHLTLVAGLVPNGLFLSISIAYALGALRIIRHGVLVQQSNAIESLSNVDVLCLDKTGTLTTNRLMLNALHPIGAPENKLRRALGAMVASASNGNKTTDALIAAMPGEKQRVVAEVPFSSARKWSAIAFDDDSLRGVYALGAPEMLQNYLRDSEPERQAIAATTLPLAEQGLRVLLVAHHPGIALVDQGDDSRLPNDMTPLGLVSLSDELRPQARGALAQFIRAGVQPKIISGDNAETVAALAKQAGLSDVKLVSGPELALMNDAQFQDAAVTATIFGRITPQQKEHLVRALCERGHYVAMIGDGVNDVLALKQAQLGVAMQSGAQAARNVADLVLMKDTFASLAPAVEEGQRILNGMQHILRLFLTRIATMMFVILSALVVGEFPLELRQGSLITLFSVGIPATAIAFWARPGQIAKGTRARRMAHFILTPVVVTSVIALLLFYGTLFLRLYQSPEYNASIDPDQIEAIYESVRLVAQSTLTAFLVLCGLLTVIFVEPPTRWWAVADETSGDWRPTILVLIQLFAFVIILYAPPLRNLFAIAPLGAQEIAWFIVATIVWLFAVRWLWKWRAFGRFLGLD